MFYQMSELYNFEGVKFNFLVSFVQIYNEKLFDLFEDQSKKTSLQI